MFLLRPTKSLAVKLHTQLGKDSAPNPNNFLLEWYAHHFRLERIEFVLFVNPETRISLVLRATPYRTLIERFQVELPIFLKGLGYIGTLFQRTHEAQSTVHFSKTQDRALLGVMNQFIFEIQVSHECEKVDLNEPITMSLRLANTLTSIDRQYHHPIELFREKLGIDPPSRRGHLKLVT